MGLRLSTNVGTAASGTKAASQPRKKYGSLRRLRCFTAVGEVPAVGTSTVAACLKLAASGAVGTRALHEPYALPCPAGASSRRLHASPGSPSPQPSRRWRWWSGLGGTTASRAPASAASSAASVRAWRGG